MRKHFKTNHHTILLDTPELADNLKKAVIARDLPRYGRYRFFAFTIL